MVVLLLCGIGLGAGLWALAVWVFPPRPALAPLLEALTTPPDPPPIATTEPAGGWAARWCRPLLGPLTARGLDRPVRADLAIIGKAPAAHVSEQVVFAVLGLLLPALVDLLLVLADLNLGWQAPLLASLVGAALGFTLPSLALRHRAARRRAAFTHALAAYLDLLRVLLAGGAGVDGALADATSVGGGWAFAHLRRALRTAHATRTTPWTTLRQLGTELDVPPLAELAASVSLAGTEGARVRASLAAKATALRTRQLTDAEGDAQAATERMSLPVVLLFGAFLVFIGYPALAQVLGGL